jgi:hypothetical protein
MLKQLMTLLTQLARRRRALAYTAALIGFVVLAALYVLSRRENDALELQIKATEDALKFERLLVDLRVPTEVIYHDAKTAFEISKLREKCYKKHETPQFLPYGYVVGMGSLDANRTALIGKPVPIEYSFIGNASSEGYWLNHTWQVCQQLAFDLEHRRWLYFYFQEHPDVFAYKVRPLLMRLLESYNDWIRRDACWALLAGGDRSDEIGHVMADLLTSNESQTIAELASKYRLDLKRYERATGGPKGQFEAPMTTPIPLRRSALPD